MDPLLPVEIDGYLDDVAAVEEHDPVLTEMERRASASSFPIVGRAAGRFLELITGLAGARHVVELGSGFGYSAYWFSRAVGPHGSVLCTDRSAENARLAEDYLRRAGRWEPVTYAVGDALEVFAGHEGPLDVVFCDIGKAEYPQAWRAAAERLDVGGVFIADNVLWYGRVAGLAPADQDPDVAAAQAAVTDAVREMTREVAEDPRYVSTIAPIRDGVLVAHRVT